MKKGKYLITGCAGFIGFHLTKKLIDKGIFVVGLDNLNRYYDVDLKKSRLNYRKYLRKLWKKVLKSPLSKSKIDPRCSLLFDQLGVTATADLEDAETDFFDLEKVKTSILDFYLIS